jgi:hypothetical protein
MPTEFNLRNVLVAGSVIVVGAHIVTGGLMWLVGAASNEQTIGFMVGAAGGTACVWIAYVFGLFCRWLRRKQVEGDQ